MKPRSGNMLTQMFTTADDTLLMMSPEHGDEVAEGTTGEYFVCGWDTEASKTLVAQLVTPGAGVPLPGRRAAWVQ